MNILKWISYSLVLIGALNWGLVGMFNFDLVAFLFGDMTLISRIVYSLVGIASLMSLIMMYRESGECTSCNC